jgi:CrcB protein
MPVWLAVALGGAVGSLARYGAGLWTRSLWPGFPFATLLVNVLGSLCMGLLAAYATARPDWSPVWKLGLMTGVLGGFTTFSAFSIETLALWRDGASSLALLNVGLNLGLALLACAVGLLLGRSL